MLQIIKENRFWMAIDKPGGLIVEKSPFEHPTIEDLAWDYLSSHTKKPFLGIVHRLDRVTSGVLLLAKKKQALRELNKQFEEKTIQKTYQAVVASPPSANTALLQHWLEKDQKNKRAIIHQLPHKNAKEVRLTYQVIGQTAEGYSVLEIHPETGKFHQIRAQLAAVNCPIVGDEKYGSALKWGNRHIALHAASLAFIDPLTGEKEEVNSKSPFQFK